MCPTQSATQQISREEISILYLNRQIPIFQILIMNGLSALLMDGFPKILRALPKITFTIGTVPKKLHKKCQQIFQFDHLQNRARLPGKKLPPVSISLNTQ